jgi:tetratricopeptide (TPR) repeat protein
MKNNFLLRLFRVLLFFVSFIFVFLLFSCSKFTRIYTSEKSTEKEKKEFVFKSLYYNGVKEKLLGNYSNAFAYFNKCLALNQEVPSVYYELSQIAYITKDLENAKQYAEKAYKMDNDNVWYGSFLVSIYEDLGDFDNAKRVIKHLIEKDPSNLDFKLELARLYENEGSYTDAIKIFDDVEKLNGLNEDISIEKERLYLRLNKYDKAVSEIKKLLKKNPDKIEYYGELSNLYMHMNKADSAYAMINKILSLEPTNGKAYLSLSEYYQLTHKTDSAFWALSKAFASPSLDLGTKVDVAYNYMKFYTRDTLNYAKIDTLIKILVKKYPNDVKSYTLASDYYSQKSDFKAAKKYLLKAKEMDKSNYLIWQQLMYIDNYYHDYDSLTKHGKEAVGLFPLISRFYLYTGIGYYMKAEYDSAISFLSKGLTYVVDSTQYKDFYYFLAEAYYRSKKIDSSFTYFDKLLKIDPSNIGAMNNYSYYLALNNRNLDKADSMMQVVLKYFPTEPNYLDTYGWVLFKKKDYEKSLHYLKLAIENGGDKSATIMEHYGDALFKAGKIIEAVKMWKKAYVLSKKESQRQELMERIKNKKIVE